MRDRSQLFVRDFPLEERPRERLLKYGVEQLSNVELFALILRTGASGVSVIDMSEQLLAKFGGLRQILDADLNELMSLPGVGFTKAAQIQAAIELGRRTARTSRQDLVVIRSPQDVSNLLMDRLRFLTKEHFITLHLDTKNQIIGEDTVSIGSLNASIVHPREIFKPVLKRSAASIICVHNHPSGDPTPSREDIDVTARLVEAGRILGIDVLDHIILGDQRFISLKEKGLM
ncbi:DNA repair protein RadC [Fodinisporobacter ferrooxydans]|uniref:DNA repair protein RadC n=1 Tax=Fodinisporobacter ferrooxydans TaxID=2901836 RepID=A0ABY4CYF7_9BACL|nr:DNA repair protein RadC [Alicyclobacillaceae bacterium MYW30-H2]